MPADLYLEDFSVGQVFDSSGALTIDAEQIKAFARQFDPQPLHLDDEAARGSLLGGLAASGWHTAALTMRLLLESDMRPVGGILGAGGEISWPQPLRPGDTIRLRSEVLEVRPSKSRPTMGLLRIRTTTFNQAGEHVQVLIANLLVPRRGTWSDE